MLSRVISRTRPPLLYSLHGLMKRPSRSSRSKRGSFSFTTRAVFVFVIIFFVLSVLIGLRYSPAEERQRLPEWSPSNDDTCPAKLDQLGLPKGDRHPDTMARRQLYKTMSLDVRLRGIDCLSPGANQGYRQDDLFKFDGRSARAILQVLPNPVRVVVLPLSDNTVKKRLPQTVRQHLMGVVPEYLVWFQDPDLYHATLFHASGYQFPVHEDPSEVASVQKAAQDLCPVQVMLERIVVTRSGVFVACWQVMSGSEPTQIRSTLSEALPNTPDVQYQTIRNPVILHTTLARLLEPPSDDYYSDASFFTQGEGARTIPRTAHLDPVQLAQAAESMTNELCGLEATVDAAWFVKETHLLALALGGEFERFKVPFLCNSGPHQ